MWVNYCLLLLAFCCFWFVGLFADNEERDNTLNDVDAGSVWSYDAKNFIKTKEPDDVESSESEQLEESEFEQAEDSESEDSELLDESEQNNESEFEQFESSEFGQFDKSKQNDESEQIEKFESKQLEKSESDQLEKFELKQSKDFESGQLEKFEQVKDAESTKKIIAQNEPIFDEIEKNSELAALKEFIPESAKEVASEKSANLADVKDSIVIKDEPSNSSPAKKVSKPTKRIFRKQNSKKSASKRSDTAAPVANQIAQEKTETQKSPIVKSDKSADNAEPEKISPKRINYLILKSRSLLLTQNFDEAHEIAETILLADPDNKSAKWIIDYINRCAFEEQKSIPSFNKRTHKQLIKDVANNWKLPTIVTEATSDDDNSNDANAVLKKLNRIVIPKISFNNTPIVEAINMIIALSEQYDLESAEDQRGVNMVIMLTAGEVEPALTLSLKNMSLDKILNFIAKSTSYQFDIEDDVIVFRKLEGGNAENLITKFFKVSRAAVIRMTGIKSSGGESKDSSKEGESSSTGLSIAEEETKIKEFLQKAGVNFAGVSGSNIAFDGSQLIITQSLRNIRRVQSILEQYEQTKQVEIETKFIEVQQGLLDEINFGWNLAKHINSSVTESSEEGTATTSGRSRTATFATDNRTLNDAFTIKSASGKDGSFVINGKTTSIPNSTPSSPGGINLGVSTANLAAITGVLNKFDLGLTLKAIEQASGSDLMSAPKLTVLSGKTAKITVAQEFIYPKTYGEISSEVGTGDSDSAGVTITAGTPSDFETRNVGVEMTVTPIVEENNCISMQLAPKVTEFEGFIEYGGRSIAIQGNTSVDVPPGFFQPIFSKREIETEVTIFDGATVVMGGLTREEIKEVNDKVPLLGDIPLLGKLFRSKGETSQKRNLLIFVTANVLTPGGTPLRTKDKSEKVYRSNGWNISTEVKN